MSKDEFKGKMVKFYELVMEEGPDGFEEWFAGLWTKMEQNGTAEMIENGWDIDYANI